MTPASRSRLKRLLLELLALVLIVAGIQAWRVRDLLPADAHAAAPPFELLDLDGQPWSTARLAGKPAVLYFFAPWCGVCAASSPQLRWFDRWAGKDVQVPKGIRVRRLHKAFLRYHDPDNWPLLREALRRTGRADLIGNGRRHLHAALLIGVHALAFLFTLYGGLFIPAFTRRWLHARGERAAAILMPLEYATAAGMVMFAWADLTGAPWAAAAALAAAAIHAWRFARWRGWRTLGEPLLWCIHLGYAWLIAALVLRAVSELLPAVPRDAWIHAFTIGAYGMLKIGLMTRVALRHTGRPLRASAPMQAAFLMMLGAALLRLAYSVHGLGEWALAASALLWAVPFMLYLAVHGPMLLAPSLPRK